MNNIQKRMSPLTALVLGVGLTVTVTVMAGATVVLYGMAIVDTKVSDLLDLTGTTIHELPEMIGDLPELISSLPPIFADVVSDRRAPDYAPNLDIEVGLVRSDRADYLRPTVTITNNGNEVVSLLALRVAAVGERDRPRAEWTEIVATPLSVDNSWRGPLMPQSKRHVLLSRRYRIPAEMADELSLVSEVTEVRVWVPAEPEKGI